MDYRRFETGCNRLRLCIGPQIKFRFDMRVIAIAVILLPIPFTAQASERSTVAFKVKITSGEVYGSPAGSDLLCDIYSPVDHHPEPSLRPVVLLVHGGAWSSGSRLAMGGHAMRLARAGIVAVAIDYRLAPRWKFPAQLDDLRQAMWWVTDRSDDLGVDVTRMGIFGYSAGGHLACMIGTLADESPQTCATTSDWSSTDERLCELIKPLAICAGGPPCDLTTLTLGNNGLAYFLGGTPGEIPEVYAAASPLTHASPGDAPTLFIHGDRDAIVPPKNSQVLYEAQKRVGVKSEFLMIEKQGHMLTFVHPMMADSMVDFFLARLIPAAD